MDEALRFKGSDALRLGFMGGTLGFWVEGLGAWPLYLFWEGERGVWGSGFGFIMIKQGVFETLSRPWFQSSPSSKTFDDGRTFNFQILGEDLSFCDRIAKESNFEVWTDPNVQLTHTKQMKLTWKGIEA